MKNVVRVLWFGVAQEITGSAEEEFMSEDTAALRLQILERHPGMRIVNFRLALNGTMLKKDGQLEEKDVIAVFPPFAGG
jgi:molybdopterin converting factor small subunit